MNLDSTAATGTQFTTSIQVFDSLGKAHTATLTMEKDVTAGATPTALWHFDVTIPNNEVSGVASTNTQNFSLLTGQVATTPPSAGDLVFDSAGKLTSAYVGAAPATLLKRKADTHDSRHRRYSSARWRMAPHWLRVSRGNCWIPATSAPTISGFASASDVTASNQNGAAAGSLNSLSIQSDGTISAVFSNGSTVDVGQLALARFSNVNGLVDQGGGLYSASDASGAGFYRSSRPGWPRNSCPEAHSIPVNVDLASELTKIITFQRGYQANAKMITATDQILQDTIAMKQ